MQIESTSSFFSIERFWSHLVANMRVAYSWTLPNTHSLTRSFARSLARLFIHSHSPISNASVPNERTLCTLYIAQQQLPYFPIQCNSCFSFSLFCFFNFILLFCWFERAVRSFISLFIWYYEKKWNCAFNERYSMFPCSKLSAPHTRITISYFFEIMLLLFSFSKLKSSHKMNTNQPHTFDLKSTPSPSMPVYIFK